MWRRFFSALLLLLTYCAIVMPAYAADNNSFDIQVSGNHQGITINPGKYPNLSNTADLKQISDDLIIPKGKKIAQTITSICTIICFVTFLVSVTKMATSGSHPIQRRSALIGILWSGVALALFGGAWVVVSFFWNFLQP